MVDCRPNSDMSVFLNDRFITDVALLLLVLK